MHTTELPEQRREEAEKLIAQIARERLYIETLETRSSDRLDFHEVGVAGVRKALAAAYRAGYEAGVRDAGETLGRAIFDR
jgi:ribosomal protein L18